MLEYINGIHLIDLCRRHTGCLSHAFSLAGKSHAFFRLRAFCPLWAPRSP